jgi:hypothetical protein
MCRGGAGQGQEGAAGLVARGYRGGGKTQGHGDGDAGAVQEEDWGERERLQQQLLAAPRGRGGLGRAWRRRRTRAGARGRRARRRRRCWLRFCFVRTAAPLFVLVLQMASHGGRRTAQGRHAQ